jgi:hypothetical protein
MTSSRKREERMLGDAIEPDRDRAAGAGMLSSSFSIFLLDAT